MKKIITHNGGAHEDDFLSCCFLLGKDQQIKKIERRSSVARTELDDKQTYVVDMGGLHIPEFKNFDHHQFEENRIECAFSLVLKHFDFYENACKFWDWLPVMELKDCRGPYVVEEKYGVKNIYSFMTGSSLFLLDMFSAYNSLNDGEFLFETMKGIGISMWHDLKEKERSFDWW